MQLNHSCFYNTKRICFSTFPFRMWEFVSIQVLFFQRQRPLTILVTCRCVTPRSSARGRMHTWFCWWFCWNSAPVKGLSQYLHPRKLTWNLKRSPLLDFGGVQGFIHPNGACGRISEPLTASKEHLAVLTMASLHPFLGRKSRQPGPASRIFDWARNRCAPTKFTHGPVFGFWHRMKKDENPIQRVLLPVFFFQCSIVFEGESKRYKVVVSTP